MKSRENLIYSIIIAASIVAIIIMVTGFLLNRGASGDDSSSGTSIVEMKQKEGKVKVTVNTQTIQEGISNMGVLITQEYNFTQVEQYTKEKKVALVFSSQSELMYSYDGAVLAGIDFEQVKISADEDEKTITVEIPHSTIQATTIDKDSFKVYSEKESLWNPIKATDFNDSLAEFEDAAKQKALDNGILDRSDEQAQKLIENFIGNFPLASEYTINFKWRNSNES